MRGATRVSLQLQQLLRLPRKMTLVINPRHTWNAIYNARNNRWHPPTSPNTAPATQNDCHDWSSSHMKRYLQCAEQQTASSNITEYCACHAKWFSKISETFLQNRWNVNYNARPIREWFELDPSWIRAGSEHETVIRNPPRNRGYFSGPPRAFCIEKYNISRSGYHSKFHRILRLPRKVTLQLHRILRLPRKMTRIIDPHNMSHVIYNAQRNSTHPPTSLNTAPATQNETHDWSAWHMKRYLQCAEQPVSSSNITEYCACHAKWLSWLILVTCETLFPMRGTTGVILEHQRILRLPRKMTLQHFKEISRKQLKRHFQCGADPRMIREWSEQETVRRNPPRNRGYFSRPPRAFCIEKYNISRSGYHSKFHRILRLPRKVTVQHHQILRLPRKVTVQHHQILRLPRKVTVMTDPRHIWNVTYNARNNQCHPPTSPNTAPATQNDFHNWSSSHVKRYFQCAEQPVSSWNISEYCACHAKWLSNISKKFLENSWNVISNAGPIREWSENDPRMIRAGNRPPQPASQPRLLFTPTTSILYWKIQHFALRLSFQISPNTAPATKSDSSTSPNTAPATKSDTWTSPNSAPATKSDTWTSPNSAPATKSDTWTPPNSAPATKSHTTLLYSSLVFATILLRISSQTNLISYESNLLRISSQTNLISNASNLLRISSQTNLFSNETLLKRISSQTNLISYESLLKRI